MTRPTRRTARLAPLTLASLLVLAQLGALLIVAPLAGAAPAVSNITPSTGNSNGDLEVTITGSGFGAGTTVTFGGVAGVVTAFAAGSLTVTTPERTTAGTVNVVVTDSAGAPTTVTNGFTYTLANKPTVSSASPNSGSTNGGPVVTVTGTNFHTGSTTPTVSFGTTAATVCTGLDAPAGLGCTTGPSATSLQVVLPPHAAGAVTLSVTNPDDQTGEVANGFTHVTAPAPTAGVPVPSNGPSNGGTSISITGTNFVAGATVIVGGEPCEVTAQSSTSLTCTTPPHAPGSVDVVVSNPDGQIVTRTGAFTVLADAAPTITGSTPATGPTTGGAVLAVTGANFDPDATATVGGATAPVTFNSAGSLTVVVPAGAAGSVNLVVRNPDGQSATRTSAFTYQAPFLVSGVSPASGTANGGNSLTISGSGFTSGALVSFDDPDTVGDELLFYPASGSGASITVAAPGHAAGAVNIVVHNSDGKISRLNNGYTFTAANAPTTASLNVASGTENGGTAVTITGTNFFTGSVKPTVTFDGIPATVGTVTATTIAVTTPPRATEPEDPAVPVVVTNPSGQSATLPAAFTYLDAGAGDNPACTSLSVITGTENGGTAVTITGANFFAGPTGPKPVVTFGGVPVTVGTVNSATIAVTTTPQPSGGAVDVIITNPGMDANAGGAPCQFTFTDGTDPTITSLSVTSGSTNGRTSLTVTGTNFVAGATVTFDGVEAKINSVSATSISLTTPAGDAAGAISVIVTNPGGDVSGAATFTYTAGSSPTVTSLSPASGVSGSVPAMVTITGTNFAPLPSVTFGGVAATVCTAANLPVVGCTAPTATQLAVFPPAHAAGVVQVAVSNSDGLTGALANAYRFLPTAPTLASASPLTGATTGSTNGGTTVTINGAGFVAGSNTVLFGTTPSMGVSVTSGTVLTAATPMRAAGSASVTVLDSIGQSVTTRDDASTTGVREDFVFVAALPPSIKTLSTPAGPASGGNVLTVTGNNFHAGSNALPTVNFGGSFGTVTSATSTTILVTVPAHVAGSVSVTVTNPDGKTGERTNGYTFVGAGGPPAPTVTSISPTSGPAAGGTNVTITGTNFASGATVSFGSSACTSVHVASGTSITCLSPPGSGTVSVSVTSNGQTASLSNAFTYTSSTTAPTISSTSPSSGSAAGGTRVTITGTNFASSATVTVGGAACTGITVTGTTSITCTTPSGTIGAATVVVTVGTKTASTTFTYATSSGGITAQDIEDANKDIDVDVERIGDDNLISFDLPSNLPGDPAGVQIWRSTSPFVLIKTLDDSEADFIDGDYLDVGAPADAKYLVTVYYGLTSALGYSSTGNSDQVPGFDELGAGVSSLDSNGVPLWVWILVAAIVLVLIVVVIVLILRRRNAAATPRAQEEGYAWEEGGMHDGGEDDKPAASGPSHQCKCPSCGTQFTVKGAKPITTTCPGCGKKGILR